MPIPDCRPGFYSPGVAECSMAYNATTNAAWSDFACNACVCTELCEDDGDCIDRGAPVPPQCLTLATPAFKACFLVCDGDEDCPGEMVCLPSMHLSENACYFPWLKPACCDQGGTNC